MNRQELRSIPFGFPIATCRVAPSPKIFPMAEFVHDAQQDFWQSPVRLDPSPEPNLPTSSPRLADACAGCGTEYMIGARFCHACGIPRPLIAELDGKAHGMPELSVLTPTWLRSWIELGTTRLRRISFPDYLRYLHFHEIKRWIGLPTASLIAFFIGLGCVAGAVAVSAFYKASNLAEFQAIQMWRMEWLLAATASFVAGILLKAPSDKDSE